MVTKYVSSYIALLASGAAKVPSKDGTKKLLTKYLSKYVLRSKYLLPLTWWAQIKILAQSSMVMAIEKFMVNYSS